MGEKKIKGLLFERGASIAQERDFSVRQFC